MLGHFRTEEFMLSRDMSDYIRLVQVTSGYFSLVHLYQDRLG